MSTAGRGRVESINVSPGGVPKRPVGEAVITPAGVQGDHQRDGRHHGGIDRAVTLFSQERIDLLSAEGHPIGAGTTGENLTVSGLDWDEVRPGQRLHVGGALLLLTRYASPCAKVAGSFRDGRFSRISQDDHPGWSRICARVLEGGPVRVGDGVALLGEHV